jgi:O-antigen/teichoic acid export membrane protein
MTLLQTDVPLVPAKPVATAAPASRRSDLRHLASGSVLYGLGGVLVRGVSFLLLPLYTRILTPEDYGQIAVCTAIVAVLGALLPLGLTGALTAVFFQDANEEARRRRVGTLWTTVVLGSLAGALLCELAGPAVFEWAFASLPYAPLGRLAVWTAFWNSVATIPLTMCQVLERPRLYVTATGLVGLLNGLLVVAFVAGFGWGAFGYLFGTLAAAAIFGGIAIAAIALYARPRIDPGVLKGALVYGLPLVPHSVAGWLLGTSDRVILERFVSLPSLGIYSLAAQLALLMSVAAAAANAAWVPFVFRSTVESQDGAAARVTPLVTAFVSTMSIVAVALALVLPPGLRVIVDQAFHGAAVFVPLLVIGFWLQAVYFVPANFLFVAGRTMWLPVATVLGGVAGVAFNLMLVPRLGIGAAAFGAVLANLIMCLIVAIVAARVYPFPYERRLATVLAAATVALSLACAGAGSIGTELVAAALVLPAFVGFLLRYVCTPGERAAMGLLLPALRSSQSCVPPSRP